MPHEKYSNSSLFTEVNSLRWVGTLFEYQEEYGARKGRPHKIRTTRRIGRVVRCQNLIQLWQESRQENRWCAASLLIRSTGFHASKQAFSYTRATSRCHGFLSARQPIIVHSICREKRSASHMCLGGTHQVRPLSVCTSSA